MRRPLVLGLFALALVGCGDGKHPLEKKYDQLALDMTAEQVQQVMGEGKPVTAAEVTSYPGHPKLDTTDLPADTRWVRWGDGLPYVLVGFSQDKVVLAQVLGVGPPKRTGR